MATHQRTLAGVMRARALLLSCVTAALALGAAGCGVLGPPLADGGPGGQGDAGPDAGSAGPRIASLIAEPAPMEGLLSLRWQATGATECELAVEGAEAPPGAVGPVGEREVAVDFAAVEHRPVVELRCVGAGGVDEDRLEVLVPYIERFTATPAAVPPEGADVELCWELVQGSDPVCAIFAENGGEYYYPLEAEGCLFTLFIDEPSDFLLYCSPANGYVERPLTVGLAR